MLDFKTLYDNLWPRMAYYASKFVNSKEEAEDIAQEVFVTLYKHLHELPNETRAQAWLYICTRNRCLNQKIKARRDHQRQPGYFYFIESDPEIVETEFIVAILAGMEKLPVERLKIFKLIFFEGMKMHEVADKLHLSINTVKSQRAKALSQLREMFKEK